MPLATERFSNRADAYVRGRPSYPHALVDTCRESERSNRTHRRRLGVGTGLSAEPFLRSGYAVIASSRTRRCVRRAINNCASFLRIAASPALPKRPRWPTTQSTL